MAMSMGRRVPKIPKIVIKANLIVRKAVTPAKAVPPSAGWIPAPRFREDKLRGNDELCEFICVALYNKNVSEHFAPCQGHKKAIKRQL
jgi:hypothetical protein